MRNLLFTIIVACFGLLFGCMNKAVVSQHRPDSYLSKSLMYETDQEPANSLFSADSAILSEQTRILQKQFARQNYKHWRVHFPKWVTKWLSLWIP